MSTENKLLLYRAILELILYNVQPYGMASNSNIKILQRQLSQNYYQCICMISLMIPHDFNVSYVRNEIKKFSQKYADRMEEHLNILVTNLMRDVKTLHRLRRLP